jgi:hypothetical protein
VANSTKTHINLVGGSTATVASKPKKRKKMVKKARGKGRTIASKLGTRGRGRSARP